MCVRVLWEDIGLALGCNTCSDVGMKGELEGETECAGSAVVYITVRMKREEGVSVRFDALMVQCCHRCGLVFGDANRINPRIEDLF